MGDAGPISLQISTELLTDLDYTMLDAPTMPIKRLGLLELGLRISERGGQIGLECWLIAFDDKKRIRLLRTQEVPELTMGVQGIKGADASADGQGGKQLASFWDLVGFFSHSQLSPDFFALVCKAGKQMRSRSFSCSGSPHRLAVDSEGIGGGSLAADPDPGRQHLLDRFGTDLG